MNGTLDSLLRRYSTSARPRSEPMELRNAGGLSGARLWRYESALGPMVARLWPANGPGREEIERVHRWVSRASGLAFVPIPIKSRDGLSVGEWDGRYWSVEPWKPGAAVAQPSGEQIAAAFTALASFHLAMGEVVPGRTSPGMVSRVREVETLLAGDLDAWRHIIRAQAVGVFAEVAERWLDLALRVAPRLLVEGRRGATLSLAVQPVIRDARSEHVLFTDDRVTGWVDFGAMGIDSVAADLARLLGTWFHRDGGAADSLRAEHYSLGLAAYRLVRPLSEGEVEAIGIFDRLNALLGGARWMRWSLVDRISFSDPFAVIAGLRRSVGQLSDEVDPVPLPRD